MSNEVISATEPLLRARWLRVVLIAAPGLMAAVATLIEMERNVALAVALNAFAGVIVSSAVFIAVSVAARRVADDRILVTHASKEGRWRARAQLLSIVDEESGLYVDWYFRLRLEEEIRRARRYNTHFAVLLATPIGIHHDSELMTVSTANGLAIRQQLRGSDLPALLRDGSLAVLLPHTRREPAIQRRIAKVLATRQARVGLACYPEDGNDGTRLLSAAKRSAEASEPAPERQAASA